MVEPLREVRDGYLISLNIGTPPQVIQVYMDTGSDLTWVPCGNLSFDCMDCDDYRNNKLSNFSPSRSSSSSRDICGSSFCLDIHSSDNSFDPCTVAGCSLNTLLKSTCARPCPSFAYTYGEGGVITGTLTRDTLRGNHFYAMSAPSNSSVVKCLLFQSMDDGDYGPAGVFGSFQQQNVQVVYDLQKERIGIQPMDCASAAASQGLHKK
ncbi:hypothetical protein Patl1_11809 [Pistacia atlantica]|uniref:Uncharacterized protein n=1 Tax=Pistacia atlantica TaxID=434234 RepID=A0ACC1A6K8_9ROSI|nr:hypothetical protein Patl1_11809 [Pistacia atlantica]